MYCSNCGLNISDKKIHKALDNDAKNSTNINYLASSLIASDSSTLFFIDTLISSIF